MNLLLRESPHTFPVASASFAYQHIHIPSIHTPCLTLLKASSKRAPRPFIRSDTGTTYTHRHEARHPLIRLARRRRPRPGRAAASPTPALGEADGVEIARRLHRQLGGGVHGHGRLLRHARRGGVPQEAQATAAGPGRVAGQKLKRPRSPLTDGGLLCPAIGTERERCRDAPKSEDHYHQPRH